MPDTSFQRFPRDIEKQICWIKNMRVNRTLLKPTKLFWKNREQWFYYTKNSHTRRRLLLREAAPLIFPQLLTHLRNKKSLHRCLNKPDLVPLQNFKTEPTMNLTTDNENTVSSSFSEEQKPVSVAHSEPSTSNLESFYVKPVDKYQVFVIEQSNTGSQNTTQELITNHIATNNTTEEKPPTSSSIDEYEALGISWVAQLRKLKESQKVLATGLISQVLQKGYFEDLTKNTRINDILSSDSLLNSPPATISFPSSLSSYCIEDESNSNEVVSENNTTEEEITMNTEVVFVDSPERVFIACSKEGNINDTKDIA